MTKATRKQIINAFSPAREITDAKLFAGRKQQIQSVLDALYSEGTNIAIIGGRGIGKTSLARQILNIAQGNNDIFAKLDISCDFKFDFLPVYYACGKDVQTINDLLIRLLTLQDCLLDWIYDIPEAIKEMSKIGGGFDIKLLKIGADKEQETTSKKAISTHEIDVIFENILKKLVAQNIATNGILIIVDEYDQIENPKGFAKLLKSLATSTPKVKFCIVGVAQDMQNLMQEHGSSDRLFAGGVINLPYMSMEELDEIVSNAEFSINQSIKFDASARKKMIELASGHPYLIHLLGRESLKIVHSESIENINEELINRTIKDIAKKETDPNLESRYKKAISHSYQRECILKSLATNILEEEISISEVYEELTVRKIDNPQIYVGQLVSLEYGAEIEKTREKYYRFKDSLFAAYVKARPWLTNKITHKNK
jgi:AAA+ ATPase superfamily predicted ATPase